MTTPTLDDPPATTPSRVGQSQSAFVAAWDAFLAWLFAFVPQMQTVITWVADQITAAETAATNAANSATDATTNGAAQVTLAEAEVAKATAQADRAEDARDIASAIGNYREEYNPASTYQIGESVSLSGTFWRALTVNTGVTPVEGANWSQILRALTPNVEQSVKTDTATNSSSTWASTGLSVTITTQDDASKVDVSAVLAIGIAGGGRPGFRITRGGTPLTQGDAAGSRERVHVGGSAANANTLSSAALEYLDSPGAAGSYTYTLEFQASSGTVHINRTDGDTDSALFQRGSSTLTAREVLP